MSAAPELLPWDTEFLGFPVARLRAAALSDAALAAVLGYCRAAGIRLLYLHADPADAATAAAAHRAALLLADHRLTFEMPLPDQPTYSARTHFRIRPTTEHTPRLEALVWQSGEYSRFRRDPGFAPDVFPRLYSQWLRNILAGRTACQLLVADDADGAAQGLLVLDQKHGQTSLELLAVDPALRGQGLGWQFLEAAQRQAYAWNLPALRLVTQADNVPACRLYRRFGFRAAHAEHLYHCWL